MKSPLYSTPMVQYLQNHQPVMVSVCGMCNSSLNALHAIISELLHIKVLQNRNTSLSTPVIRNSASCQKLYSQIHNQQILSFSMIYGIIGPRCFLFQVLGTSTKSSQITSCNVPCSLPPTAPTKTLLEPVQATIIEDMSCLKLCQTLLS